MHVLIRTCAAGEAKWIAARAAQTTAHAERASNGGRVLDNSIRTERPTPAEATV